MSAIDIEILKEFQGESKALINNMKLILEQIEGIPEQAEGLADFGNNVDRIMGTAQSLALTVPADHLLHKIADYSAICKAVGYKSSQIKNNDQFYDICIALLWDGTEVLETMINNLTESKVEIKELFSKTFLERLRWVSSVFGADVRGTVGIKKSSNRMDQGEIDNLLKKLGLN